MEFGYDTFLVEAFLTFMVIFTLAILRFTHD